MIVRAEVTGLPSSALPAEAVVIGASAGGPQALERLLATLPPDFRAPVAVCQHMPHGFIESFAWRLDRVCSLTVKQARNGEPFKAGTVYIAAAGKHMRVRKGPDGALVRLDEDFADSLFVPSIDILMGSVSQVYGSRALGVLLTGLCSDGAQGMLALRRGGGHTICQSVESAEFESMPRAALAAGAVAENLPLELIGPTVVARGMGR